MAFSLIKRDSCYCCTHHKKSGLTHFPTARDTKPDAGNISACISRPERPTKSKGPKVLQLEVSDIGEDLTAHTLVYVDDTKVKQKVNTDLFLYARYARHFSLPWFHSFGIFQKARFPNLYFYGEPD